MHRAEYQFTCSVKQIIAEFKKMNNTNDYFNNTVNTTYDYFNYTLVIAIKERGLEIEIRP